MARRVKLYTVDHTYPPHRKSEGIVDTIIVGVDCNAPGPTYADMCAQSHIWPVWPEHPIVGFQGYRKHLDFRKGRELKGDWVSLNRIEFNQYQNWQEQFAAENIRELLDTADILTNQPYNVIHNGGIAEDFRKSASATDWLKLETVMRQYGDFNFNLPGIVSYCVLTTTGSVFNHWMAFWYGIISELAPLLKDECKDPGPRPDIYLPRRMAFLSERIFSLWLDASGLRVTYLPLLVCWELADGV